MPRGTAARFPANSTRRGEDGDDRWVRWSAAERAGRGGTATRGERLQQLTGGPVLTVRARARGMRERPEAGLGRGTRAGLAGMALVRAWCGEVGHGERKAEKGQAG